MKWISVEDRLPPMGKPVLIWDRYGNVKTGGSIKQVTRNKNSQKNFWQPPIGTIEPRYSHWMPLPKSPNDKKTS